MIVSLAQVVFFLLVAVLLGLGLRWVLDRRHVAPRGHLGALLFGVGTLLLIVAVARYGERLTVGLLLALVGSLACATGVALVTRADDA